MSAELLVWLLSQSYAKLHAKTSLLDCLRPCSPTTVCSTTDLNKKDLQEGCSHIKG